MIMIYVIFKTQENHRFSASEIGTIMSLKIEGLFQINFKLGRFFYLVKYNRTVVLPDIRNV